MSYVLVMHSFGLVTESAISWAHNGAAPGCEFVGVAEPELEVEREEGYFRRYEIVAELCRTKPAGTRWAYLDNDAVHLRRKTPLTPDLKGCCVGAVRCAGVKGILHNCGGLYGECGPGALRFLETVLEFKAAGLAFKDLHADEHAFDLAAAKMPGAVAALDPAWNNWQKATGERFLPAVVQGFHAMAGSVKLAAVQASVKQSVALDL